MLSNTAKLILMLFLCTLGSLAYSADKQKGIRWNSLNPQQQTVLAPFREQWLLMPEDRQRRMLSAANQWLSMGVPQRNRARQRFFELYELEAEDPERFRNRVERYEQLDERQKAIVQRQFLVFQSMTKKRKQELLDQWRSMSPEERKKSGAKAWERND